MVHKKTSCFSLSCLFFSSVTILLGFLFVYGILVRQAKFILSSAFWGGFLVLLFFSRKRSALHTISFDMVQGWKNIMTVFTALAVVLCCVIPMSWCPTWNGENPEHRNQYELLAESFINGHLYIDYSHEGLDELLTLENPYDPVERQEKDISFHWDHAYYNGHYYMYFGVVPVLLLFLPFRLITGISLTTYHATQVFSALVVLGIFAVLRLLTRLHFPKIPFGLYLLLSAVFSAISVWYAAAAPALYCTAITAGIAMQVWSIYLFCKAVWDTETENKQILLAGLGALLGALTFGCRPTIGLANIVVIPLLCHFLRQRKLTPKLLCKLFLAALPYVIIAAGLMIYNYVRFDNPFEFGQSYQLTVTDQRNLFTSFSLIHIFNEIARILLDYSNITDLFPHVTHSGIFINFPIFLCSFACFFPHVQETIRSKKLLPFIISIAFSVFLIILADTIGSPYLMERYNLDVYFLLSILSYLAIGLWYESAHNQFKVVFSSSMMKFSILMLLCIILHFLYELRFEAEYYAVKFETFMCFWRFM